jgi:hypothetical protein
VLRRVARVRIGILDESISSQVRRLLLTANVVPMSPTVLILMMEALLSSETLLLTRATESSIQKTALLIN